ncbi:MULTISPECIES: amino acid permease [Cysteiniphilum]|uniref:Amino acid transporter n=1 Tax=Cysteiniphilum litorale TaxID=2056700 RepID=A0A8J2Z3T2_9GAMM|nr:MULTISPECIES: aromatic amino acid transport family protein [Cysteiniphilum]GGF94201.1 amino acid transporter [Cysteiniphilum litorale]
MTRLLGGAFLVVGTTIGAGMLSLPLITAACGLWVSIVLIIISWSVMYLTALRLIKVCAHQPLGVNFTSLIKEEMPKSLQVVFTLVYLLLLYALMAAYTTQGASLVNLVSQAQVPTVSVDAIVFILIFGLVILSTRLSDYVNRSFVSVKLVFYVLCVVSMLFALKWANMLKMPLSFYALVFAWPTLLPSFGFQNIIPVLYEYQKGDVQAVKRSVFIGSIAVLVIYIIWLIVCLAILPQQGVHSYETIFKDGNTLTALMSEIKQATQSASINTFLSVFVNISIITSFICVGLSLYHYIRDTFRRFNIELNKIIGFLLTFIPPFIFTVFYPKGFILALQYAAIFAVVIFVFTPIYLDKENRKEVINFYPLVLGALVIIAQVLNLAGIAQPF